MDVHDSTWRHRKRWTEELTNGVADRRRTTKPQPSPRPPKPMAANSATAPKRVRRGTAAVAGREHQLVGGMDPARVQVEAQFPLQVSHDTAVGQEPPDNLRIGAGVGQQFVNADRARGLDAIDNLPLPLRIGTVGIDEVAEVADVADPEAVSRVGGEHAEPETQLSRGLLGRRPGPAGSLPDEAARRGSRLLQLGQGLALDEVEAVLPMEDEVVGNGPDQADTLLGIGDAHREACGLAEEAEDVRVVLALLDEDELDVARLRLDDTAHLAARVANHDAATAAADAADRLAIEHIQHKPAPALRHLIPVEVPRQLIARKRTSGSARRRGAFTGVDHARSGTMAAAGVGRDDQAGAGWSRKPNFLDSLSHYDTNIYRCQTRRTLPRL